MATANTAAGTPDGTVMSMMMITRVMIKLMTLVMVKVMEMMIKVMATPIDSTPNGTVVPMMTMTMMTKVMATPIAPMVSVVLRLMPMIEIEFSGLHFDEAIHDWCAQ